MLTELSPYDTVILSLDGLSERELYRLSWQISERLVQKEQERLYSEIRERLPAHLADLPDFDNDADNYGGW